jgi:hypothetical protein
MKIQDLIPYVIQTRQYGSTYVHTAVRQSVDGFEGLAGTLDGEPVTATFCGYGRSLQGGGHKYKAHLRFAKSGKPVRSKDFSRVQA